MAINSDLVQQLWGLCHILRDDGITYHQYVNELSYLLFLKMAEETGAENTQIPEGYRWSDLASRQGVDQFKFYHNQLVTLGTEAPSAHLRAIFAYPTSLIRKPESLNVLVDKIDHLDWYRAKEEGLGDLYEGLLQKNASEKKSGAGQYFTPRALIDSMVSVMKPTPEDIIQDPAAGTGGFLVAADRFIREHSSTDTWTSALREKYTSATFYGMEHVQDTHRLALMNLMLHGIKSDPNGCGIRYGDTLGPDGQELPDATLFLTNPPFGTKTGGGLPTRSDLPFPTSNKQFSFLQHIYLKLVPGGRAAVVLPDNVLFEGGVGRQIRLDLMEQCNLHTILRLPTGIFYAQGVKTNVLFFTRGSSATGNTGGVWVYDLRTNMPQFNKRVVLEQSHFLEFEHAFGDDPHGNDLARRRDAGETGRFRYFDRASISGNGEKLDLLWLQEQEDGSSEDDPAVLAQEAIDELEAAVEELRSILELVGGDIPE